MAEMSARLYPYLMSTMTILSVARAVGNESILLSRSCHWDVNGIVRASHAVSELASQARFPLPELTGDQFPLPVNTGRVDWSAFPLGLLTVNRSFHSNRS